MLLGVAALVWGRRVLYAKGGKVVDRPRTNGRANLALAAFAIYRTTPYGAWLAPVS